MKLELRFKVKLILFVTICLYLQVFNCASPKMEEIELILGDEVFTVEVARKKEDKEKGLMYRESLDKRKGMLFVYKEEKRPGFWNANVNFPLSIAFINKNRIIMQIEDMEAGNPKTIRSRFSICYALELLQGTFNEINVEVGDKIIFPHDFEQIIDK